MLRKVALSLAVAAAFSATNANALGLGEINVTSALNEPLSAQIQLLQVKDLSPMQIQPQLANIDDYSLAGLSKSQFLQDVTFQVRVKPDGTGYIEVHTKRPIKEPFLNMLLEVNWPDGRLVREYTLLLDPPSYDPSRRPAQIAPAQTADSSQQNKSSSRAGASTASSRPASSRASNIRTNVNPKTEFYVDVKDTLWGLAMKYRPDSSVTGEQMMLALLRKNPQAFPSGNINVMRAGVVMKIPTLEEIRKLTPDQASAEVKRQTQAWREGRSSRRSSSSASASAAPAKTTNKNAPASTPEPTKTASKAPVNVSDQSSTEKTDNGSQDDVSSRLQVVSPEDEATDQAKSSDAGDQPSENKGESSSEDQAHQQEVSQRLNSLQDNVSSLQKTNEDLTEQLKAMTDSLKSIQGALSARDQQLKSLQDQLAKQQEKSSLSIPVLGAIGGALIALILAVLALLRGGKGRKQQNESVAEPVTTPVAPEAVVVSTAAAAAVVSEEAKEDKADPDQPAHEAADFVAEESVDTDTLDDLDLNMDLDLDSEPEAASGRLSDLDDDFSQSNDFSPLSDLDEELSGEKVSESALDNDVDDSLDDLLGTQNRMPEALDETSDLPEKDATEDAALDFSVEPTAEVEPDSVDDGDDLTGLDFDIDLPETEETGETGEEVKDEVGEEALEFSTEALSLDDEPEVSGLEGVEDQGSEEDDSAIDPELDSLLANDAATLADEEESEGAKESSNDAAVTPTSSEDLDELLASFNPDDENSAESQRNPTQGEKVERELTANIAHDLESDLDSELDEMLSVTDNEIALEDERNDFSSDEEDFDGANLLEGADESETKLDLARAYIEMDDKEGARDILNEVVSEGNHFQRREAQRLIESLES